MSDVDRQIRQMADFINLEAKEKANEIRMKVRKFINKSYFVYFIIDSDIRI